MRNISDKICTENQNTHFMFGSGFFVFQKSYPLWDNVEIYGTVGQTTDENMAHARFTLGSQVYKYTFLEYVILIVFPLQPSLHEVALMLLYTYIACIVQIYWRNVYQLQNYDRIAFSDSRDTLSFPS
jgi:hypothetical protein